MNRVFRDIDQKRKTTQYLHLGPELADEIPEIKWSMASTETR